MKSVTGRSPKAELQLKCGKNHVNGIVEVSIESKYSTTTSSRHPRSTVALEFSLRVFVSDTDSYSTYCTSYS